MRDESLGHFTHHFNKVKKKTPWPESASELYRPSDRCLSAKLVPTFADRGCHVVNVTDLYGRNIGFLDLSRYFFFQVAPHLYSRGWVDLVPDPLLLRKSGIAGNRTRAPTILITYIHKLKLLLGSISYLTCAVRLQLTVGVRADRSRGVQGGVVARGERRAEARHGLAPWGAEPAASQHGTDALGARDRGRQQRRICNRGRKGLMWPHCTSASLLSSTAHHLVQTQALSMEQNPSCEAVNC
jgi:hypothetical protein